MNQFSKNLMFQDWDEGFRPFRESQVGCCLKGGASGGTNTVEKSSEPWAEQKPYLLDTFAAAQNEFNSSRPDYFGGQTYADFNPNQQAAQQNILDYTGGQRVTDMQQNAEGVFNNVLTQDPNSNPVYNTTRALAPMGQYSLMNSNMMSGMPINVNAPGIDAAGNNANPAINQMLSGEIQNYKPLQDAASAYSQQATDDFMKNVMPQIRSGQIAYQPGGSSRGDIATGVAAEGLGKNISNNTASLYNQAYNQAQGLKGQAANLVGELQGQQAGYDLGAQGLYEQARGARAGEGVSQAGAAFDPALSGESNINQRAGLAASTYPSIMAAPLSMYGAQNAVGDTQQILSQQGIDEAINRFNFEQNREKAKIAEYQNLVSGNLGGTSLSTSSVSGGGGSGLMNGMGGAMSGASVGSAAGPWGAAAGGLIGGLMGAYG